MDLVFCIRSNGDKSKSIMNFDFFIQYIDQNDVHEKYFSMFAMDPDLDYNEEDENFYIENFTVQDETDLEQIAVTLRKFTNVKMCGCAKYLVKDDYSSCYECMLHDFFPDQKECGICLENISNANMLKTMDCCRQSFHKACLTRYQRDDIMLKCPVCRENEKSVSIEMASAGVAQPAQAIGLHDDQSGQRGEG